MISEFELISRYFKQLHTTAGVSVGIGDDAALVEAFCTGYRVVCSDMLVENRHFFSDDEPYDVGWKSLAVNLSDIAAMGATPHQALLSIALPKADTLWLANFSTGFFECAKAYNVHLIGGDTTCGPLTVSVTAVGHVEKPVLLRKNAQIGDTIWVSGKIGMAALGLQIRKDKLSVSEDLKVDCLKELYHPIPRIDLGLKLAEFAHAAIDISDGLLADLTHILRASTVGARVSLDALITLDSRFAQIDDTVLLHAICHGGDDYELCFTTDPADDDKVITLANEMDLTLTPIGRIMDVPGLVTCIADVPLEIEGHGFDHFLDN